MSLPTVTALRVMSERKGRSDFSGGSNTRLIVRNDEVVVEEEEAVRSYVQ